MIAALAAIFLVTTDVPPGPPGEARLERCFAMIETTGKITLAPFRELDLNHTSPSDPLLTLPAGKVMAIDCGRDSIVPAKGDFRVLRDYRVPLNLTVGERLAALEISGGQVRLRMIDGKVTTEEERAVQARLDDLQLPLLKSR